MTIEPRNRDRPCYRVAEWDQRFERAESRRVKAMLWVPFPNSHDGGGYLTVMSMENGPEIYCAWTLIVQVASRMPTRGLLANANGPLGARDLALRTHAPERIFDCAFEVLTQPEIGWLELVIHDKTSLVRSASVASYGRVRSASGKAAPTDRQIDRQTNYSPPTPPSGGTGGGGDLGLPVCDGADGPVTQSGWKTTVLSALGMAPGPAAQPTRIASVARKLANLTLPPKQKRELAVELYERAKEIAAAPGGLRNPSAVWVKQALERIAEFEA